jgi:type II secretory pathway pseudopilin PulG
VGKSLIFWIRPLNPHFPFMKSNFPRRIAKARGLTLLELTIVILVLLSLVAILFIGAQGWKNGTDRAGCILQIRNVQVAMRSYQNLYGYNPGAAPALSGGTQNVAAHLLAKGYIEEETHQSVEGARKCQGGGTYSTPAPDIFPPVGVLYMECSLATDSNHVPKMYGNW